jgi:hypothetical protein
MSSNADTPAVNLSSTSDIPLFVSGLGPVGLLIHLLTHPRIIDFVKLFLLGVCGEAARRLVIALSAWLKYYSAIYSVHLATDESYDWLMAYWVSHPSWQQPSRDL